MVVAIVAFACIAIFSCWPWSDSPWTAASAMATFCAAGVALWLGLGDKRRRDLERKEKADALAASLIPILDQIRNMVQHIRILAEQGHGVTDRDKVADGVASTLASIRSAAIPSDVLVLGNLNIETAKKIAFVQSRLEALGLDMGFRSGLLERGKYGKTIQEGIVAGWAGALSEVERSLLDILSDLHLEDDA